MKLRIPGKRTLVLPRLPPLPGVLVSLGGAAALASTVWACWVLSQPPALTISSIGDVNSESTSPAPSAPAREWIISERALAATLVDELFPKPPIPPAPAEPPRLDVQLVAILGEGDRRRAFVRDTRDGDYLELDAGREIRDEVVLASIEENAAIFTVGGTPVRLELAK